MSNVNRTAYQTVHRFNPADATCHVSNSSRVSDVLWRGSGGEPLQWHRSRPTTPGYITALTINCVEPPWEHEDTTPVMTQVRVHLLIFHHLSMYAVACQIS